MSQPLLLGTGSSGQMLPMAGQNSFENEMIPQNNGPNSVNGDMIANTTLAGSQQPEIMQPQQTNS